MVSIHACDSYSPADIEAALDLLIKDLGGLDAYFKKGESVLLKVNMLLAKGPQSAATTHPALVEAFAARLVHYGCSVFIGDSPGGPFNAAYLKHCYQVTGIAEAAKNSGAELVYDTSTRDLKLSESHILKTLTLTNMSLAYDKVVSLCKLKTHSWMTYTGAEKNLFGCVPGNTKAEYHVRMPDMEDFSRALVDIYETVKPRLSLMDAVIGMEGNGPSNGTPRKIGCLIASPSAFDLDRVACRLIGLSPENIPSLKVADELKLGDPDPEVLGDAPAGFVVPDYKMPDHIHKDLTGSGSPLAFIVKTIKPKVTFDYSICIGCGRCHEACPPKALTMVANPAKNKSSSGQKKVSPAKRPTVDHKKCIRCYCCQELCPQNAVVIKENFIVKIMQRL